MLRVINGASDLLRLRFFRVQRTTSRIATYVGIDLPDWRHANRAISNMHELARPESHRVWYLLVWEDGATLLGRIEIGSHPMRDSMMLSRHVKRDLQTRAGRLAPAGMDAAGYAAMLRDAGLGVRVHAVRLLDRYDLGFL